MGFAEQVPVDDQVDSRNFCLFFSMGLDESVAPRTYDSVLFFSVILLVMALGAERTVRGRVSSALTNC